MENNYSEGLWLYMEDCYRSHGASSDASQLILRAEHLTKMANIFSEDEIADMLKNDFYTYHNYQKEDSKWKTKLVNILKMDNVLG